jgi:hypothetical protein
MLGMAAGILRPAILAAVELTGIRAAHTRMESNAGDVLAGVARGDMTTDRGVAFPWDSTVTSSSGQGAPAGTTARLTNPDRASFAGAANE